MPRRPILIAGSALLAISLAGAARGAQEPPPAVTPTAIPAHAETPQSAPAPATVAACADCHEEAGAFARNPHARNVRVPGGDALCASCHGDGTAHAESGGDKALIRVVRGAAGTPVCLGCHESGSTHASLRTGVHARGETVNCLTCHAIHTADRTQQALLVEPPDALCASCHESQAASHRTKPFAHRIGRGGMSCLSCHDPHAAAGRGAQRLTRAGETPCVSCHAEKRGPFVFPHVTDVAGSCTTCHEPHGSSNPKRLVRAEVYKLCLECHSTLTPGLLGSQPPSTHDLLAPRWRNCTTCHVAVHGSNRSPRLFK
jgi:DmsE family decaheme c-type cytochrome